MFTYPSSCIAINNGGGRFTVRRLPDRVQLSCVNAIYPLDMDGHIDLVMGGNNSCFLPQFGRLDASFGHVLQGDGRGNFQLLDPRVSGLQVQGVVRDIAGIGDYLIFGRNDDYPALYKIHR